MRTYEQAIIDLTDAQRQQLLTDYEQFECDGCIGDCLLRTIASSNNNVSLAMILVAMECYRYFATLYQAEVDAV